MKRGPFKISGSVSNRRMPSWLRKHEAFYEFLLFYTCILSRGWSYFGFSPAFCFSRAGGILLTNIGISSPFSQAF
jgi:hypothetical protein